MLRIDSITQDDKLQRRTFALIIAKNLFNAIKSGDPGFAVGLAGKWGSGKSTLIDFLKSEIREEHSKVADDKFKIIDFNPWMYSGQKELQTLFFSDLNNQIPDVYSTLKPLILKASKAVGYFSFVKYINATAGNVVEGIENISKKLGEPDSLRQIQKEIDDKLSELGLRLYIFIDDLDRLPPNEIAEVLQLVKLNASFKNTIYILAYDKAYINSALKELYKENADRYLDKIIQVEYSIPDPRPEQIENFFFDVLKKFFLFHEILFDEKDIIDLWLHRDLSRFMVTIRDIYRFVNALQLRLPSIHQDIYIPDFLMLECLRLFEFDFYEQIVNELNKGRYKKNFNRSPFIEKDEKLMTRAQNCFKYLELSDYHVYGSVINNRKRFADPAFTHRYLTLSLSSRDVTQEELDLFFDNKYSLANLLSEVGRHGRIENLLRRLKVTEFREEISVAQINTFVNYWNNKASKYDEYYIDVEDVVLHLINISKNEKAIMRQFIDSLTIVSSNNVSITQFTFLDFFVHHFGRHNIGLELSYKVKDLMAHKMLEIQKAYEELLRMNIDIMLNNANFMSNQKLDWHFIERYSQLEPNLYSNKLNVILDRYNDSSKYKDILSLADVVMWYNRENLTFNTFQSSFTHLLPPTVLPKYLKVLNNIDNSLLNAHELFIKTTFLSNIGSDYDEFPNT